MIRVLDTNTLRFLQRDGHRVRTEHQCYVPEGIQDEFNSDEASETWFQRNPFVERRFDESEYLGAYARHLNAYSDVSFYNMKGFGDVSILAVLDLLIGELNRRTPSLDLFGDDGITLVSGDRTLVRYAKRSFPSLKIETYEEFTSLFGKS